MNPNEPNPRLDRVRFELRADGVSEESTSPLRSGIHHRGYLPHVKRDGAAYFVTFRLADSLPKEVMLRFLAERAERLRRLGAREQDSLCQAQAGRSEDTLEAIERDHRRKAERHLDQGIGACHLRRPDVATMVSDALRHFHGQHYLLDDWVVMPNHVHLILWPMPNFTLSEILKSRKQFTATKANCLLRRTGQTFWQAESFDHWIRDDDEKSRIRRYIRANPVKAGLCASPEEWRWGSAWREGGSPADTTSQ